MCWGALRLRPMRTPVQARSYLQSLDEQTMTSQLLQTDTAKGPIWSAASRTDTFVR
jgi:hypothetical protein